MTKQWKDYKVRISMNMTIKLCYGPTTQRELFRAQSDVSGYYDPS